MKLAGFSAGFVVKTGIAAVLFIVLLKFLAVKTNIGPLQSIAAAV